MKVINISQSLGIAGIQVPDGVKVTPVSETIILLSLPTDGNGLNWTVPMFTQMDDNWDELKGLRFIGNAQEILNGEKEEEIISRYWLVDNRDQLKAAVQSKVNGGSLKNFLIFKIKSGA